MAAVTPEAEADASHTLLSLASEVESPLVMVEGMQHGEILPPLDSVLPVGMKLK